MSEILEDEVQLARVIEEENNKSKLDSKDIINIIKQGNLDNVNVAKYNKDETPDKEITEDLDKEIIPEKIVEKQVIKNDTTIEKVTEEEEKNNDVDDMFKRIGMTQEMQNEVRKMLEDIQNTYQATFDKKERELESKKFKEIEDFKKKLENDTLRALNAEEQEKYRRELQTAADKQKIDFLSKRVNELENHINEIENQKFISEKISSCPAVKPFIDKMKIKTKEEYINKIEPIIEDIKQYDDFRKNNKNGNSNAFKGYGRQSQYNSTTKTNAVDKAYMSEFFKNNIMK